MTEKLYTVLLVIILVPYCLLFLLQLWVEFGQSIRSRLKSGSAVKAEEGAPASGRTRRQVS